MKKPLYQRVLASREFTLRADAEEFISDMKDQYKQAEMSVKGDIERTVNSGWRAIVYVKV